MRCRPYDHHDDDGDAASGNHRASGMRAVHLDGGAGRMVFKIAHQVVRTACFRAAWRSSGDPRPSQKRFIVDFLARRASSEVVVSSPRTTPFPARLPWRVARSFSGAGGNGRRMEARQGAMRIFFWNPIVFRSAPHSAIRLHLMRDPVNPARFHDRGGNARASRAPRLCKIAHQVFMEAGSGALPAGITQLMTGTMRGFLKKCGWPPAALPPRTHPRLCLHRAVPPSNG